MSERMSVLRCVFTAVALSINLTKNSAVSTASWQNWAWSNPVAWLCSWKPRSSTGGEDFALWASAKSYSSHSIPSRQTWQPWPRYQARAGQCQHCWHLNLVGPDRDTDPLKDIFFFFGLQAALEATRSKECPPVKTKSATDVRVESKEIWVYKFSGLPQSFRFVETDCRAGKNPGAYDTYCADKWCKRKMQGEEQGWPQRIWVLRGWKCVLMADSGDFCHSFPSCSSSAEGKKLKQTSPVLK